ncbi:uncharacterized protein LOC106389182 isoform X1 [Brassica napus]|uniref:uncharacterized protein LOC106389182 isoform X1 n=1 Tax=Brassica napus TaxID=3708 RepID=UPI000BBE2D28|nr:uncharacterized protein LOC106389182 isoform X1 [Brassica napus]XP_048609060.1 uncharacterized protein LOC106389182 isoform X1 [Brassica napus]
MYAVLYILFIVEKSSIVLFLSNLAPSVSFSVIVSSSSSHRQQLSSPFSLLSVADVFCGKATSFDGEVMMGSRGVISDKWSMRILWGCALGSAIGLYMVAVERQTQNRARALAEGMRAAESQGGGGDGDGSV